MIKFKYKINDELAALLKQNIVGIDDGEVYGIMSDGVVNKLKETSMYLICNSDYIEGNNIFTKPLAVVARNDVDACAYYLEATDKLGYTIATLEDNCSKVVVVRVEDYEWEARIKSWKNT